MMAVETCIYDDETVISASTNKPVGDKVQEICPVFWCEVCKVKLPSPTSAIAHLNGKPHKQKELLNTPSPNNTKQNNQNNLASRKRVFDSTSAQPPLIEPLMKKTKEQLAIVKPNIKEKPVVKNEDLKCEDCNIDFNNPIMAIQHFKGKRHATAIAKKIAAKQQLSQRGPQQVSQRNGNQIRGTQRGGIQNTAIQRGGIQNAGIQKSGIQGGAQRGGSQRGGAQRGGAQRGGAQRGGAQRGGIQRGGVQGGSKRGGIQRGGGGGDRGGANRNFKDTRVYLDANVGQAIRGRVRSWTSAQSSTAGVPVGGQYGNAPPPFDPSSSNFSPVEGKTDTTNFFARPSSTNDRTEQLSQKSFHGKKSVSLFNPPIDYPKDVSLTSTQNSNFFGSSQRNNAHTQDSRSDFFGGRGQLNNLSSSPSNYPTTPKPSNNAPLQRDTYEYDQMAYDNKLSYSGDYGSSPAPIKDNLPGDDYNRGKSYSGNNYYSDNYRQSYGDNYYSNSNSGYSNYRISTPTDETYDSYYSK